MRICGLILAAGGSSRLGQPKQLVKAGGKSLIEITIECINKAGIDELYVVLGAHCEEIKSTIAHLQANIVKNGQWENGIGSSISTGIDAIRKDGDCDAALIMLCDQPGITPAHLTELIHAYCQKKVPLIATGYGGEWGVPAIFDRQYFPELHKLSGDEGAKKIIRQQAPNLHCINFEPALLDIDRPEDLDKLGINPYN